MDDEPQFSQKTMEIAKAVGSFLFISLVFIGVSWAALVKGQMIGATAVCDNMGLIPARDPGMMVKKTRDISNIKCYTQDEFDDMKTIRGVSQVYEPEKFEDIWKKLHEEKEKLARADGEQVKD